MSSEIPLDVYCPGEVTACLTRGTSNFIGRIDDTTVLKYPLSPHDAIALAKLGLETRMLQAVGPHRNIIGYKGHTEHGLLLEYASCGSVRDYLMNHRPSVRQRLEWAYQATEAVVVVHRNRVLHRNITVDTILLDDHLNVKLSGFHGHLLAPDGSVLEDGGATVNAKSCMPLEDGEDVDNAEWKSELFALGSAFYYLLESREPYPDLHPSVDDEEIVRRFTSGQFPAIKCSQVMSRVVHGCWRGDFESAWALLGALAFVHVGAMMEAGGP